MSYKPASSIAVTARVSEEASTKPSSAMSSGPSVERSAESVVYFGSRYIVRSASRFITRLTVHMSPIEASPFLAPHVPTLIIRSGSHSFMARTVFRSAFSFPTPVTRRMNSSSVKRAPSALSEHSTSTFIQHPLLQLRCQSRSSGFFRLKACALWHRW